MLLRRPCVQYHGILRKDRKDPPEHAVAPQRCQSIVHLLYYMVCSGDVG
jgi:hypothetical protein